MNLHDENNFSPRVPDLTNFFSKKKYIGSYATQEEAEEARQALQSS